MALVEIIVIAVGLSMDAFAISITLGLAAGKTKLTQFVIPGIYFGFFQALMPFAGYFAGSYFANKIQHLDHWIAFVLLGIIGIKMIKDSFSKTEKQTNKNPFNFGKMLLLALATSIDALAVGITFAFFEINIFIAILITGLTTFCLSTGGTIIGNLFGTKFRAKAELMGGTVLVLLGIKILAEHLINK
jgi:putative Mn2+ efflux pump MntP